MKKLTVLVAVMLITGLLTGCWLLNQAPIITSEPILNAKWNTEYVYDVEADDPDGDVLTYSLTVSPTSSNEKYVMTIEPSTGVIEWLPSLTQLGLNQVIVEVTDGRETAIQSFVILVIR